jgi:hypothetical protein
MVGVNLLHLPRSLGAYLRSHKTDPLWKMLVAANAVMAAAVFLLGRQFAAVGSASGYAAVIALIIVPGSLAIWYRFRQERNG